VPCGGGLSDCGVGPDEIEQGCRLLHETQFVRRRRDGLRERLCPTVTRARLVGVAERLR